MTNIVYYDSDPEDAVWSDGKIRDKNGNIIGERE